MASRFQSKGKNRRHNCSEVVIYVSGVMCSFTFCVCILNHNLLPYIPGLSLDSPLQKFIWSLMTCSPEEVRAVGLRERDF